MQAELNRHAWVLFAKGLSFDAGDAEEDESGDVTEAEVDPPELAPIGTTPEKSNTDIASERLANDSAEDLQRWNQLELAVMGVPEELREEFLSNESYSPKHRTVLVGALAGLEGTEGSSNFH